MDKVRFKRAESGSGAALFLLMPLRGILKYFVLLIRNDEFREATIQANENLRKHPNDRFVETVKPVEMECDFSAKTLLLL